MFLKPAEGLKVYDPARKDYVPAYGRDVGGNHELYWSRHLRDGSVTIMDDAAGAKAVTEGEAAEAAAIAEARKAAPVEADADKKPAAKTPAPKAAPAPAAKQE